MLSPQKKQENEGLWMPHAGSCLGTAFLWLNESGFVVVSINRRRKRYSIPLHQLLWLKFKRERTQCNQFSCVSISRQTLLLSERIDVPVVVNRGQDEQITNM